MADNKAVAILKVKALIIGWPSENRYKIALWLGFPHLQNAIIQV